MDLSFKKDNPDDEKEILKVMLHAVDLSNPTMDYNHYLKWASLIV